MQLPPFQIRLYDKGFTRLGFIEDPADITVNLRHNDQPTATFSIPTDHPRALTVISEGTRAVINYYGRQIVSGPLTVSGGGAPDGLLTVEVRDHWSLFTDVLGFQAPAQPVTDQTSAQYDTRTGPAETVLKAFAQAAITRLGLPVTVATDQGRGSTITVPMRMNRLADQLFPLVDQAGLGTRVRQVPGGLELDVYEPAWYPLTLSPQAGIVQDWSWVRNPPTVTRAVAGGQGDGVARVFRSYVDTAAETLWGFVRETFVDATDAALPSDVTAAAHAAVLAGAATTGLSLTLAETDTFRYGDTLRVGDLVTTQLVPGAAEYTDVLREAVITWNAEDGLTAVPSVGDHSDDPDQLLGRVIAAVARAYSRTASRR